MLHSLELEDVVPKATLVQMSRKKYEIAMHLGESRFSYIFDFSKEC